MSCQRVIWWHHHDRVPAQQERCLEVRDGIVAFHLGDQANVEVSIPQRRLDYSFLGADDLDFGLDVAR